MNWEGYSENASAALDAAQAAAEELHHGFIGTEHILIGLLRAPGTAGECLRKCGADESMVFPYADTLVGGGRHIFTDSRGFAPPAKRVLELALYEAKAYASRTICTKHILLAVLRETDCFASPGRSCQSTPRRRRPGCCPARRSGCSPARPPGRWCRRTRTGTGRGAPGQGGRCS